MKKILLTSLVPASSITILLFLATFVSRLRFFVDDFPYALDTPSLTRDFFTFFASYITVHGLFRPLALVYYWFLYSFYFLSDSMAHLLPFAIHAATGYILYRILKRHGMNGAFALLGGFLYLLHPFATEQYMWLSAGPGTIVNGLFLIQLVLIEKMSNRPSMPVAIAVLSTISVLLYESTFFFFIPLIYLIWTKTKRVSLVQIAPIIVYIITKLLLKGTDPRPLVDSFPLIAENAGNLANNLSKVYMDPYYVDRFWNAYRSFGLELVLSTPLLMGGMILFVATALGGLFITRHEVYPVQKSKFIFWTLVFLATLPPLVANKIFFFGFRSLFLPSIAAIVTGLWAGQMLLGKNGRIALGLLGLWTVISFFMIDITIADKYRVLYDQDMKLAQAISQRIKEQNLDRVSLILKSDVPFDSRESFLHADHLLSCFFYEWSSLSCLKMTTGSVHSLTIEHVDGRVTRQAPEELPIVTLRLDKNRDLTVEKIDR